MFKWFMSAESVVDASLRDLKKGKVICVPGLKYKLLYVVVRLVPRRVLYWLVKRHHRAKRAVKATVNE